MSYLGFPVHLVSEPADYSSRAPVFSRELRIWGTVSFLGTEALFVFFPAFPHLYLGIEALFAFSRPAVIFCGLNFNTSDRPRLYENQSDLPPNSLFSRNEIGAGRVAFRHRSFRR